MQSIPHYSVSHPFAHTTGVDALWILTQEPCTVESVISVEGFQHYEPTLPLSKALPGQG